MPNVALNIFRAKWHYMWYTLRAMDRETLGYYAAFSQCFGIGPLRFTQLMKHFGSVKKAYSAKQSELEEILDRGTISKFLTFKKKFPIKDRLKECDEKGIHIITREDSKYPQQLLNISDAPVCLYAKGNLGVIDYEHDRFFAIVGTRSPTTYGEYVADLFARELSEHFVIVSGLAYGIDAAAHTGALETGNKTIAFLGCGVDITYPMANKAVYDRIVEGGGLVMSEFPPGMQTLRGHFVARNRLISGLSEGVLVVEGAKKSGTLITARYAADQGKDVFAPPAPINSDKSEAPNLLIKDGAKFVTSPSDILEEYGLKGLPDKKKLDFSQFALDEKKILELMVNEKHRIDDIIVTSGLSAQVVMNKITLLEVQGIISKNADGTYQVVR